MNKTERQIRKADRAQRGIRKAEGKCEACGQRYPYCHMAFCPVLVKRYKATLKGAPDDVFEIRTNSKGKVERKELPLQYDVATCDPRNAGELIDQLEKILPKLGVTLTFHPCWEGQSDFGIILSNRPLTKTELGPEGIMAEEGMVM